MTGLDGKRVYLDWNATAPLRPEARAAMLAAMDAVGNPSSVHAEGRAAKAIVEKARGQVAALVGCEPGEVVFTSGATEAAAMTMPHGPEVVWPVEHDCVWELFGWGGELDLGCDGRILPTLKGRPFVPGGDTDMIAVVSAQNETGVIQPLEVAAALNRVGGNNAYLMSDAVQALGRVAFEFRTAGLRFALASAHKLGGPKGSGALIAKDGQTGDGFTGFGGAQERGARGGTENVIGIAGFGAAAEAAGRDLEAGVWDRVGKLRDDLEDRLASVAPDLIVFGKDAPRLPNTSCFAVPGWRGETQVMQMDLAGFAVSAGSACSSGKVNKASRVLLAMGFDEVTASSAIRVSMGPTTTEAEVMAFADAWIEQYRRRKSRAA